MNQQTLSRCGVLRIAGLLAAPFFLFPTAAALAFPPVISTREGIDLNGNSLKADSYDSSDPTRSTGGLYDPQKAGDAAELACAGGITNWLPIGTALIYGHVYAGSNSVVMLGTNGGVGTHAWLAANTGIEPGYEMTNGFLAFPDAAAPYNTATVPGPGDVSTAPGITNHYEHVLYGGDYLATDLAGATIVMGAARLVLPNGLHMGGNDAITIAPGAGLALYCAGSSCAIGGNGILNQSGFAGNFVAYCSASLTNFSLSGNAPFIGIVVASNADLSLNAGGSSVVDFSGALLVRSLNLNGNFSFHQDQALTTAAMLRNWSISPAAQVQFDVSGIRGFSYAVQASGDLTSWTSLVTNNSPFTFSESLSGGPGRRFYRVSSIP